MELATNVQEAIARLNPDLDWLVLDLMLPDGEGEDVLRALLGAQLPARVVVTTGVNDPVRLKALALFQPARVLAKPIDLSVLFRTLGV